ncbi:MAG: rhodanese-like domain-containing protein [Lautropia sp.]
MLLNVAAYHFVAPPPDRDAPGADPDPTPASPDRPEPAFGDPRHLEALRAHLRGRGRTLGLSGTVLLAPEGINLFACGEAPAVRALVDELRAMPALAALATKESWSREHSFRRWLVKSKKEIITFGRPALRPAAARAPAVAPETLARWLDAGRDDDGREVVLVDTRNAFEVGVGTFEGALDPGIRSFTELPAALLARRDALDGRKVVTFCTGGIRCEKAALWLEEQGIGDVVQLDGGILGYFEAVGGRHWRGECFVFDRRVSLRPDLREGSWRQAYPSREIRPSPR